MTTHYPPSATPEARKAKYHARLQARLCVNCGRPATATNRCDYHRAMVNRISAGRYKRHPGIWKVLHQKQKAKVMEAYGGKCQCCGETRLAFLSIDHINGGGRKHRKEVGSQFYHWITRNQYPPILRILCMNCNTAVRMGKCPHQIEREAA